MAINISQHYTAVGGPDSSGNLRVARQYIDVVQTHTDGQIRVTRQYINVLYAVALTLEQGASNTLSFIQTASYEPFEQDLESTLTFTSYASGYSTSPLVESIIPFVDEAYLSRVLPLEASNALTLLDAPRRVISEAINSGLLLFQFLDYTKFKRLVCEHGLGLSQTLAVEGYKGAVHDLGFIQTLEVLGPVHTDASDRLSFVHEVRNWNIYLVIDHSLGITDQIWTPIEYTLTSTLTFTQFAQMEGVAQILEFLDSVDVGKAAGAENQNLYLTHSAVQSGGTFRRSGNSVLGISDSLTYYDLGVCTRKHYTPFMGDSSPVPGSIPTPQFSTGPNARFLLYYPARGVRTSELTLRAPNLGNRDRNAYTRISRETRGGQLIVYADSQWVKTRTLAVTFVGLSRTNVDEVQEMFYTHLGQLIGMTDWEGNEWEGVITDPNEPATQDGKEKWTMTFKFEGEMIDGHSPGSAMDVEYITTTKKDPGANTDLGLVDTAGGADAEDDGITRMQFLQTASAVVV